MRILCLDDSGKTDPKHPSKVVAYAGFTFDEAEWPLLHRRITGAKAAYFPLRAGGRPNEWELKSDAFLTPNKWKRKRNREFCYELVRILRRSNCSVYAVTAEKAKAYRPVEETWLPPLMFQRMAAKLIDEVDQTIAGRGMILCDWTSYKLDRHLSNCIGSYAVSRNYQQLIGGVTYGSSRSLTVIQAADLIAGAFRISLEGGDHLGTLIGRLGQLEYKRSGIKCVAGFPMNSIFKIF